MTNELPIPSTTPDGGLHDTLHTKINSLLDEYSENADMLAKIETFICTQLPNDLRNLNNTRMERENRKMLLETRSEDFIESFIKNTRFYYCNSTEIFFEYKDYNYSCIREDNVLYNILNAISSYKALFPWKYKIKVSTMKLIKECDILSATPNTETIQCVLSTMEEHFKMNKECAKYFMTIIGDIMLRKNTNIYFVNSGIKTLLKELSNNCYLLFGTPSIMNNFKYKYHDHKYGDCRLLQYTCRWSEDDVKSILKNKMINIFIVASYFSTRYESADNFIAEFCKDPEITKHAFYLKERDESIITSDFTSKMVEDSIDNHIKWKDMSYLWKTYNEMNGYPNIMFSGTLKEKLMDSFGDNYDKETDSFANKTSSFLPDVQHFIEFWGEHIYETDEQIEYEIDELYYLFQTCFKHTTISEDKMLSLIRHYFSDTVIEENKYLLNIGSYLWDKKEEASEFIDNNNKPGEKNDLETLYIEYKKQSTNAKKRLSKRYFEKILLEEEFTI